MTFGTSKNCAGLVYGTDAHHLDHIAPLCCIMKMPLVLTENNIAAAAKKFYPALNVLHIDYLEVAEYIALHFDVIFCSLPRDLFDEIFFLAQKLLQKKVHTFWCPHGNSDKGNTIIYMEALKKEEAALVYGKQMIEFIKRKGSFDQLKAHVISNNYRYAFYLEHKSFYDQLIQDELLDRLPQGKQTILYAPTWRDYEQSSSFFDAFPHLAENLPPHVNLIIKLHPNLLLQHGMELDLIFEKYQSHPRLFFVNDFPPVYPLLNKADVYLGDMSSIGYDFLAFNRPMFFLNQNGRDQTQDIGLYLFRCGVEITKDRYASIYSIIENFFNFELKNYSAIRKDVYAYAFGHPKSLSDLQREIEQSLPRLLFTGR